MICYIVSEDTKSFMQMAPRISDFNLFQARWNRQKSHVLASCHDGDIKLWDIRKPSLPTLYVSAHLARIFSLDWSRVLSDRLVTSGQVRNLINWSRYLRVLEKCVLTNQSAGEVCFNQSECFVSAYRMVIPATLKFDFDINSRCYATLHPSLSIFKPKYLTIFTEDQTQSGSDKHGLRCNPSRYLPNCSARRLLIADIFFLGLLCQVPRHFHSHRKAGPVAEDGRAGLEG